MPASNFTTNETALGRRAARLVDYLVHHSVEVLLLCALIYLCLSRGLAVDIAVHDPQAGQATSPQHALAEAGFGGWFSLLAGRINETFLATRESDLIYPMNDGDRQPETFNSVARTDDPAPHISNLTLVLSPDYGERKGLSAEVIAAKRDRVQRYLQRHAAAARREMEENGIPASITLAQALLESNAGDSKLAVNSNNHFGIKCRAKCLGCTCRNYGDDTRYDMFRVFDSVADSFSEHSRLLNTSRYAGLKAYGLDYVKWAHGLKKCGYATDPRYGHKLVTIIENLGLQRYDRAGV